MAYIPVDGDFRLAPPEGEDETSRLLKGLQDKQSQQTCGDKISNKLLIIVLLATLIIGSIGAAGILPGSTIGYCAIGIGVGYLACKLISDGTREKCGSIVLAVVLALIPIILGSLGATGVLSGTQMGWGLTGIALATIGATLIGCCGLCCITTIAGAQGKSA